MRPAPRLRARLGFVRDEARDFEKGGRAFVVLVAAL